MSVDNSQRNILVALLAIHKERITRYEELLLHVPKDAIMFRSVIEDIIAQGRTFKQALIEVLSEYGDVQDITSEPDRPEFYDVWCGSVRSMQGKTWVNQVLDVEKAILDVYQMILITPTLDESLEKILQSQQDELDYGIAKVRLAARKATQKR